MRRNVRNKHKQNPQHPELVAIRIYLSRSQVTK